MKLFAPALCGLIILSAGVTANPRLQPFNQGLANSNIDMEGYLRVSVEASKHRETRRLTEDEFIRKSQEKGVVILDARSKEKFDMLHIKGAINLSFSDIDVESLKRSLPDKDAMILIYCNNNFQNAELVFPTKMPTASLNLSTYIALYNYGYNNVYELAPRVDPKNSKLTLVSTPKNPK